MKQLLHDNVESLYQILLGHPRDDNHTLWRISLQEYLSATMLYALFEFRQEYHVSYMLLPVIATYFLRIVPNLYICVGFCIN